MVTGETSVGGSFSGAGAAWARPAQLDRQTIRARRMHESLPPKLDNNMAERSAAATPKPEKTMTRHPAASTMALVGAVLLFAGAPTAGSALPKPQPWRPIFNGRSLDGWVPKIAGHPLGDNYRNTFVVDHGSIRVSYARYDRFNSQFGHLIYR